MDQLPGQRRHSQSRRLVHSCRPRQNPNKKGPDGEYFNFIDSQTASTLFTVGGLNIPFDEMVTRNGPLASVFLDTTVNGFDQFPEDQVTSCTGGFGAPTASIASVDPYATVVTFTAPSSAVLGQSVPLQVSLQAAGGIPAGKVDVQEGRTVLGTAQVDANGNASTSLTGLALGAHDLVAYFYDGPHTNHQSLPTVC